MTPLTPPTPATWGRSAAWGSALMATLAEWQTRTAARVAVGPAGTADDETVDDGTADDEIDS